MLGAGIGVWVGLGWVVLVVWAGRGRRSGVVVVGHLKFFSGDFGDFGVSDVGQYFGDFGDFGVSETATVAWRYTRRGGPRLSVQGEPLVVLTRGP